MNHKQLFDTKYYMPQTCTEECTEQHILHRHSCSTTLFENSSCSFESSKNEEPAPLAMNTALLVQKRLSFKTRYKSLPWKCISNISIRSFFPNEFNYTPDTSITSLCQLMNLQLCRQLIYNYSQLAETITHADLELLAKLYMDLLYMLLDDQTPSRHTNHDWIHDHSFHQCLLFVVFVSMNVGKCVENILKVSRITIYLYPLSCFVMDLVISKTRHHNIHLNNTQHLALRNAQDHLITAMMLNMNHVSKILALFKQRSEYIFTKIHHALASDISRICSFSNIPFKVKLQSWRLLLYILLNQYQREILSAFRVMGDTVDSLVQNRYLAILVVCSVYGMCKVYDQERTFKELISAFESGDTPSIGQLFREIPCVISGQHIVVDIVKYYNRVFLAFSKTLLLSFLHKSRDQKYCETTEHDMPHWPYHPSQYERKIGSNIKVSPLTRDQIWYRRKKLRLKFCAPEGSLMTELL